MLRREPDALAERHPEQPGAHARSLPALRAGARGIDYAAGLRGERHFDVYLMYFGVKNYV